MLTNLQGTSEETLIHESADHPGKKDLERLHNLYNVLNREQPAESELEENT